MEKIFIPTFKDAAGKFTIQNHDIFSFSYGEAIAPQVNPFSRYFQDFLRSIGLGDAIAPALEGYKDNAAHVMADRRGITLEAARARIEAEPDYISWYMNYPRLDTLLPSDVFKMLPWRDKNWRDNAKYLVQENPLPWSYEAIEDHFAHVLFETNDEGKREPLVVFFASPEHGEVRRVTKMKPGRYLTKFYPSLDGETIKAIVSMLDKADGVKFAASTDDIVKVYTNGPRSCMAYELERYESNIHPTSVYGESDLQLAYLSFVDLDAPNFRATARCLVWPERKLYGRIYGDDLRMSAALKAEGFREGRLDGAKIRRIEQDDEYLVMPYIDGCCAYTDHGDYCTIGGNKDASSTSGVVRLNESAYCPGLDDYVDDDADDFVFVTDRDEYCSPTYVDRYCFQSDRDGNTYTRDCRVRMANGDIWSESEFMDYGFECERTGRNYDNDDAVHLEDTNETVCLSWAEANAHCADDGTWYAEAPEAEDDSGDAVMVAA